MHEYASLNGVLSRSHNANFPVFATGLLYGKGVFTSIAVIAGEPFLWGKHWKRLRANSAAISLDLSNIDESLILQELRAAIAANGVINGRSRITLIEMSPGAVWPGEPAGRTARFILTGERRTQNESLSLTISNFGLNSTSPLAGVKSCNYLENHLALEEAGKRGFDEAARLNERGEVTGGCMANLFWSKDGKLYTPSLNTGCLAGTTREHILENFECEEVEAGVEELVSADSVFLTSAGLGIKPASVLDGKALANVNSSILEFSPF